jgi:hypothetical protein
MICTDCMEQLLDYNTRTADEQDIMDRHLAGCESCREFRTSLSAVDVWLDHEFPSLQVSTEFTSRVRSRIRNLDSATQRPFLLPAILDFAGYFSVAVSLAVTMIRLFPKLPSELTKLDLRSDAVFYAACLMFVTAVGFAIKVYTDIGPDSRS